MKKTNLLIALAITIMASASGVVQVQAAQYNYFVDFSTKEVANYSAYKQTFNDDTSNLTLNINFEFFGEYRLDTCPTNFTINMRYFLFARANAAGSFGNQIGQAELPDFPCTTTYTYYEVSIPVSISSTFLDLIVDDDTQFVEFLAQMQWIQNASTSGRTLSLRNYSFYFDLTYDFGTTYLFNYFLSDQNYQQRDTSGTWTFNITPVSYLNYVYTTAGNDSYYIRNTNTSTIGTTRKKYAIDYNQEFFRGESVGAGFFYDSFGANVDTLLLGSSGSSTLSHRYRYYYLNVSNVAQAIVDAPVFNFDYEDCGSFLALNVGCFINNGLAYITNDAPIISDAITLLNAGIELGAQTFGIIGEFADDNIFGFLILVGFGFIAIKWLLKND